MSRMPDMDPTPRMTIATPEAERDEYLRRQKALEDAARFKGLLRDKQDRPAPQINPDGTPYTPDPYATGLLPPTDAERARLDAISQINPELTPNALARARLDAEREAARPPQPPYMPPLQGAPGNPYMPPLQGAPGNPYSITPESELEPEELRRIQDRLTGQIYTPPSESYMPPPAANTAYMPQVLRAEDLRPDGERYMPSPTAAPVNTAYMPPPAANTAYMPPRQATPVNTAYMPPASANTTYMPSPAPTYGMSTTPTYNMSNAQTTTPSYGGQIREPSFSPNQAGKYKVDSPRLKNTGGLFNDLNAFFGRPQT